MLSKFFFRRYPASQFQVLNIPEDKILAKLFIQTNEGALEITQQHCIVSIEPFTIAVIAKGITGNEKRFFISSGNKNRIRIDAQLSQTIKSEENEIHIFEIKHVHFSLLSTLRLLLLKQSTRSKINTGLFKKFAAMYTVPREVVLISFSSEKHFNIFPMDFVGYFAPVNIYLFGLRTTNITLDHIINEKKLVAASFESDNKQLIYQLGKHHSSQAPDLTSLPFDTFPSETFRYPIPAFASGYREVGITGHFNIGSHTLLIGKPVFEKKPISSNKFCHIDTIEFLSHSHWYSPFLLH